MSELPLVVQFDLRLYNLIHIKENTYFVLELADGTLELLRSKCPHRGGPLHLGKIIELNCRTYVECPWHNNKIDIAHLKTNYCILKRFNEHQAILEIQQMDISQQDIHFSKTQIFPDS